MSTFSKEDYKALCKLLEKINPCNGDGGAEAVTKPKQSKPPFQNEFPFDFHYDALEHIGFAVTCFHIFMELERYNYGGQELDFIKRQFVLSCLIKCGDGNDEFANIGNGYGDVKETLAACVARSDGWQTAQSNT